MNESVERDEALLLDMILAARDALSFLEGLDEAAFMASRLHQNPMIRSLEVMGEAAGKVSSVLCAANPQIPWREITGMRHRLAHNYKDVALEIVWYTVTESLGPLITMLEPLITGEGKGES